MAKDASDATRVVVTGVGVVSPVGVGNDAFWTSLRAGSSGIRLPRAMAAWDVPSRLAAEVPDFDPLPFVSHRKMLKVMSRDIQLGVSAAALAMRDARLAKADVDPDRFGVVYGSGHIPTAPEDLVEAAALCGAAPSQFDFERWGEDGMSQIYPLWLLRQLPNMSACHVAIEHDARGPNNTITSREASPLLALAEAVHTIRRGVCDAMLVGGCGSEIHPVDITRFNLSASLTRTDDPLRACRPFDRNRDGGVLGEGAATFVLEDYHHAVRRGAEIYAEVLAVTAGCDGRGYLNGAGGTGLVRAMETAFARSGIRPDELGHINAHGKATRRDDLVEARAYHRGLGDAAGAIPVVALKGYFGESDAGAGALELAASLLAVRHGLVPPTLRYETPDPHCRLNVVHGGPRPIANRTFLTVNRTSMGQSAAAILRGV
jgi:3-oxoacyl-[acyl-carrier-protein] synthase II